MSKVIRYSVKDYPFIHLIEKLFNSKNLSELHTQDETNYPIFEVAKDSNTVFHEIFYDKMRSGWDEFTETYTNFIANFVRPYVDEDIIYQKWPTFRVHLPNNLAVGAWHTDAEFNHPEGEINFILPITRMFESNTVITESEPGLRDFKQVELEPGELFVFNGNKCMHGNLPNKTGSTRISLDFRVLKKSDYSSEKNKSSITTNTKFVVGEYYERLY